MAGVPLAMDESVADRLGGRSSGDIQVKL